MPNPWRPGDAALVNAAATTTATTATTTAAANGTTATSKEEAVISQANIPQTCADRVSATLVNKRLPAIFNGKGSFNGGVLLQPEALVVRCSYAHDGNSIGLLGGCPNEKCIDPRIAGCANAFVCRSVSDMIWWKCGWRGKSNLKSMLSSHVARAGAKTAYNEVVIERDSIALPSSIAAFFYTSDATDTQKDAVIDAHQAFLNIYHRDHSSVPLVVYEGASGFREVQGD